MVNRHNVSPEEYIESFLGPGVEGQSKINNQGQGESININEIQEKDRTKSFLEGTRRLKQNIKTTQWDDSFLSELMELVCVRYIINEDTSYKRSLVPILQQLHNKNSDGFLEIFSSLLIKQLDFELFETAIKLSELNKRSHLVSCLLDFNVGQAIVSKNLEIISDWSKRLIVYFHSSEIKELLDEYNTSTPLAMYAFRNIAILASRFHGPLTNIPQYIEDILFDSLTDSRYNLDTVSLISLALATSLKDSTTDIESQAFRVKQLLSELFKDTKYFTLKYPFLSVSLNFISTLNLEVLLYDFGSQEGDRTLLTSIYNNCFSILLDSNSSLCKNQGTKALSSWFNRVTAAIKSDHKLSIATLDELKNVLTPVSRRDKLLDYIMAFWIDPSDNLGESIRELFEAMLNFHLNVFSQEQHDGFLDSLVLLVIGLDWHRKIRYSILSTLLPRLDIIKYLTIYPNLVDEILKAYQGLALATRSSDCLIQIYRQLLTSDSPDSEIKKFQWLDSLCRVITSEDNLTRKNVSNFLLPKLAKLDSNLILALVDRLQASSNPSSYHQHGIAMVLKAAKEIGVSLVAKHTQGLWSSLFHSDLGLRNDILSLISTSRKTTSPIKSHELAIFRKFLPLNMRSSYSDFRQQVHCHFKQFLKRVSINVSNLSRDALSKEVSSGKDTGDASYIELLEFLNWILQFSLFSLYPGTPYQRANSALKFLVTLYHTVGWEVIFRQENNLNVSWTPASASSLFIQLSSIIISPYDTNQSLAVDLIATLPLDACPDEWKHPLMDWAVTALQSPKASDVVSGAIILQLMLKVFVINRNQTIALSYVSRVSDDCALSLSCTTPDNPIATFFISVVNQIKRILDSTVNSGQQKSELLPIHGLFKLLQLFFSTVTKDVYFEDLPFWKECILVSFALIYRMFSNARDHLISSALPDEETLMLSDDHQAGSARQALVSFYWRGLKEAAAALGTILTHLPDTLASEHLERGGLELQALLIDVWHRGAFSALVPSFKVICSKLLQSGERHLVIEWLENCLRRIILAEADTTQRSAGVPLCIISILNALSETSDIALTNIVQRLFSLAELGELDTSQENVSDDHKIQSRVHGLNVLRSVFQDAGIGAYLFDRFGSKGLVLATDGLGSSHWGIRNSSLLLFSTILSRVFGIKRVRDEHDPRNQLTVKEFFARFPEMRSFLLETLDNTRVTQQKLASLFPALSLMSRLYSRPGEIDTELTNTVAKLIEGIVNCASCPIFKIRELSGRALSSLVPPGQVFAHIENLFAILKDSQCQNRVHGILLQVLELVRGHIVKDTQLVVEMSQRLSSINELLLELTSNCDHSRVVLLDIFCALNLNRVVADGVDLKDGPIPKILTSIRNDSGSTDSYIVKSPLVQMFPSPSWLSDPDYEIRKLSLELLPSFISSIPKECKEEYHERIVSLVQKPDIHLGTLIQALKTLTYDFDLPLSPSFLINSFDCIPADSKLVGFTRLVYDMAKTHFSCAVRASSLELVGSLFSQIGYPSDSILFEILSNLSQDLEMLSNSDQDILFREAASKTIISLLKFFDPIQKHKIAYSIRDNIFKTLVNLLQDDDEDVRDYVARGLFTEGFTEENLCPEKTLEDLFKKIPLFYQKGQALEILLSFVKPPSTTNTESFIPSTEKVIFEVERPNFHIEPLVLVQLALSEILNLITEPENNLLCLELISPLCENAITNFELFTQLLKTTPITLQVQLGGPLGLTGNELGFSTLYQSLSIIFITSCLAYNSPAPTNLLNNSIRTLSSLINNLQTMRSDSNQVDTENFVPFHPIIYGLVDELIQFTRDRERLNGLRGLVQLKALTTYMG